MTKDEILKNLDKMDKESLKHYVLDHLVTMHAVADLGIARIGAAGRLAAYTVFEQRLEELKHPEITGTQLFVDVLITMAMGPIATNLLNTVTKKLMGIMLKPRIMLVKSGGQWTYIRKSLLKKEEVMAAGYWAPSKVNDYLNRESEAFKIHHKIVTDLLGAPLDTAKRYARDNMKAAVGPKSNILPRGPELPPRALPAVTVISKYTEQYTYRQTQANKLFYEKLKNMVAFGQMDNLTLIELGKFLVNGLYNNEGKLIGVNDEANDDLLLEEYRRTFEEAMWVLYFMQALGDVNNLFEYSKDISVLFPTKITVDMKTSNKFARYLLTSFPHPKSDTGESFLQFHDGNIQNAIHSLKKRFVAVQSALQEIMQGQTDIFELVNQKLAEDENKSAAAPAPSQEDFGMSGL